MKESFIQQLFEKQKTCPSCPAPESIYSWYRDIVATLFPEFAKLTFEHQEEFTLHLKNLRLRLEHFIANNPASKKDPVEAEQISYQFFDKLEEIHTLLTEDVQALYDGDPAAKSLTEVIRTYPGFMAISAYRIAHQLHQFGLELIPRIIAEYAHRETGIDIHPGAEIGHHFCIDHGTGIVIGETTNIGNHVKLYQGVTLGALSVDKADAKIKRHPTIEDHVVIYAGATILGGETVIGQNSIIGGNVWLTRSVPADSKIYYKAQMTDTDGDTDTIIFKGQAS